MFSSSPGRALFFLLIAGLAIPIGGVKVADYDIWWHLASGAWMWKSHLLATADLFSYTAFGKDWINHEWLSQVLLWKIYELGGVNAFTMVMFGVSLVILLLVFRTMTLLGLSRGLAALCLLLLLPGVADRILIRPYLFGLALTAFFALELQRFLLGKRRHLWHLLPLQILWINLHGGGILGFQLILAAAVGVTLHRFFRGNAQLRGEARHLWVVGLLAILASCISPFGIDSLLFPIVHLKMKVIMQFTGEWLSAADARVDELVSAIAFRIFLPALLLSFIANRRGALLPHFGLIALACLLGASSKRFIPECFIIGLPILAFNLRATWEALRIYQPQREWGYFFIALLIGTLFIQSGFPLVISAAARTDVGIGVEEEFDGQHLIRFLEEEKIHGPAFNDMALGGMLIFGRWPHERVFIDGRTPIYGDQFYASYLAAFHNAPAFERLAVQFSFNHLILMTKHAWEVRHMHAYLAKHKDWRLVWFSPVALVYVRNAPHHADLIKRRWIKLHPVVQEMKKVGEIR